MATLTPTAGKLCQKIYESSQWEACFLNVLCSHDYEIVYRGVVTVANIIEAGKEIGPNHGDQDPRRDQALIIQGQDGCQQL